MENEKILKLTTIVNPHGFWKFYWKVNYLLLVCQISYSQNIYLEVNIVNL